MYILNGSHASYLRSMYFYIFGIKYEYVPPAVSKNKFNHIDTDQKTKKNNNTPRLSIVPKQVYMVIWPACIATYIYFKFMSRPIYQNIIYKTYACFG